MYMFLLNHFAFFDFVKPMALFYMEYVYMMILFANVGFYIKKILVIKKDFVDKHE